MIKESPQKKINNNLIEESLSKEMPTRNNIKKPIKFENKSKLNKSKSIKHSNGLGNKLIELHTHSKNISLDFDSNKKIDLIKKYITIKFREKQSKKELINQAAVEILKNTENVKIEYNTVEKKDNSFWGNIFSIFNPFKCGNNN